MSKKLKIGVFGLGVVGQGFYELLEQSKNSNLEIKKIVVKNSSKTRSVPLELISTQPNEILEDPEIDIVVELIDDAETAFQILRTSLQNGKPVVTANKKMLAENLKEIYLLQQKYNTPVLYEGAVGGSIPIIRNLEQHYSFDSLKYIQGILNGSTNYILTKMIDEKRNYAEVLNEAQKLGFAESDPTLDVKGFDSKYKLAIVIAHAFGTFVHPDHIINIGINQISEHDIRFAKQQGCTIKLIAKVEQVEDNIFGIVAPQFIPATAALANVKDEFNGISLIGAAVGQQVLTGKGAGSLPTGLVVFSDVAAVANNFSYSYSKVTSGSPSYGSEGLVNVRVSFKGPAPIHLSDFEEFIGGYQGYNQQALSGWVSTQKLKEWGNKDELCIILNSGDNFKPKKTKKVEEFCLV